MLENLTGLHIYIGAEGSRGGLDLMRIILRTLPKLKDLVIHRSRHDSVMHFTPGGHSHSIERFSCTDISCMKIRPLLQQMPNLKYLELQSGLTVQEKLAFPSIQSFTLNCIEYRRWHNFPLFISALPNLYALDLSCGSA